VTQTTSLAPLEVDETGANNPYLQGPYAPVDKEVAARDLEVIGEIPDDLDGVYARTGPNPQFDPVGRYHWFDGDGMAHAVRFGGGTASYRNRWVRTTAFTRQDEANANLWVGIMERLADNPADQPLKDSSNTDLLFFNGDLLSLFYLCGDVYALDPVSLQTRGRRDYAGTLPGRMSAHAKVDEHTGELMFFEYDRRPQMRYGVIGPDARVTHFTAVDLPGPRLPHDMAITQNYSILMDLPLINDPEAARNGRYKLLFDRDTPSRYGVIPRHGSGDTIKWFEAEPCYVYHSINAWEEGDEIVLDLCRVTKPEPRADAVGPLAKLLSYLRLDAHLYRYRFNMRTGATTEGRLDDDNIEFPSINLGWMGRPSRYSYNVHISPEPTLLFDGIVKFDTDKDTADYWWSGPGRWVSEAPFAPRPGAVGEDDGYVVSFLYDQLEDRSEVVILDAADITAGPIGRVLLPQRVPIGFHATWIPGDKLGGA
jgi:carotenoid cleavage dioxygenase-like enzyme